MHSMNDECQSRFAEARKMLAKAESLNTSGQHGAALKLAYEASEYVASGYLTSVTGRTVVPSDAAYDLFAKAIRGAEYHPALPPEKRGIVGDVCVLREAYEPALLDETTAKDAQQMIGHVVGLLDLVKSVVADSR